jgi:ribonuclease HII
MVTIKLKERFIKNQFEKLAWQEGAMVCGIDEVGRGCLAGPVVTAAAILLPGKQNFCLKDSKLLSQQELQTAYKWVTKNAIFSTSLVNHREIDVYNIYYATMKAMKRALMQLLAHCPQLPRAVLIDAMPLDLSGTPYHDLAVYSFPFGEQRSTSIAAASIIAKVTRDNLMHKLAASFPQYHLAQHKGYCTKMHQEAVRTFGSSIIHRERFLENKSFAQKKEQCNEGEQQTIC